MNINMTSQIEKVVTIGICVLWTILIFIDYWYFHPEYKVAFQVFQYVDLMVVLIVLGMLVGGGGYLMQKNGKTIFFANGLGLLSLLLLISALTIYFHFFKIGGNLSINIGEIFIYLSKMFAVILATYAVFITAFSIGDLFFKNIFSIGFKKREDILLKIAIGVTIISILLFLLGAFNLLNIKFVLPIFLLALGFNWKGNWQFIQTTLLKTNKNIAQLNWLGFSSLYLLLIFVALIFLQNIRPYPFGFDALVLYLNLPQLIENNQGLISGFSPYYWSLFITLGYILFDHIEVVIALSVSGGILSAFFIYSICRKWLDMNYSLLAVILFYSLPLINYQSYRDVKTDLGLLFILLAVVVGVIKWLSLEDETAYQYKKKVTLKNDKKKQKNQKKSKAISATQENIPSGGVLKKYLSESNQLIILIGMLSGMAIGIKLTGLILIFSVLGVFAYIKGGEIGFSIGFILIFAVVLLGGLEVPSGLRAYHFGANSLKIICLILGILGVVYLFIKKRSALLDLTKIAFVYLLFTGLIYLPWPIKNYQETNTLSINTFIKGKADNQLMDINEIIKNAQEIEAQ